MTELPPQAVSPFGALVSDLRALGWVLTRATYDGDAFGNIVVDLTRGSAWLRETAA